MPMLQELAETRRQGNNVLGVNAEAAYTDDAKKEAVNIPPEAGCYSRKRRSWILTAMAVTLSKA